MRKIKSNRLTQTSLLPQYFVLPVKLQCYDVSIMVVGFIGFVVDVVVKLREQDIKGGIMFKKEIEELNKAIKHLENDILPSKCNGNISCYNEHTQLYKWLKELKSYKEIRTKNNEDIFEEYAEKWWYNEYSPHTYTNSKEVWKNGAEFGYNKANEWHYVKDGDLPNTDTKNYTYIRRRKRYERQFTDYRVIKCYVLCQNEKGKITAEVGYFDCNQKCFFDKAEGIVIAWKEIVLPGLPKENE